MLRCLDKKVLNELSAGVYAFNLTGNQELYLNKFLLRPIKHLNKVYKVPFQTMLKRTIHPDDVDLVISGYDFIIQNPDGIHVQLRRVQVHADSDYYWFINFLGFEDTIGETPQRVRGIQFEINPKVKPSDDHLEIIKEAGYEIDKRVIELLFGDKSYAIIKFLLMGYNELQILKKANVSDDYLAQVLHRIRFRMNIPIEWHRYLPNILLYLIKI